MMRRAFLLVLIVVAFLVAGCAQVTSDITVNSDFSGEWKATIQTAAPMTKGDLLGAVTKNGMQTKVDFNKVKLIPTDPTGKELSGATDATPSQNWKLEAQFANQDELAAMSAVVFNRTSSSGQALNVIYPYGDDPSVYTFNLGRASGATTIKVDGTIDKNSVGKGIVKSDDTVMYTPNTDIRFQFKRSSGWGLFIGIAVVVLVVGAGGYMWYRKRR